MSNKTALIVTVGTRDIQFNPTELQGLIPAADFDKMYFTFPDGKKALSARHGGRILLNYAKNNKKVAAALHIPIIQPILDYIFYNQDVSIDQLVLVATDQPNTIEEKYRGADTLYFANCIKYLFEQRHGNKIVSIETHNIAENVTYVDEQFTAWQTILEKTPFANIKACNTIYLCTQGGIDAINTGLMFSAILKYQNRLCLLGVNEQTKCATELHFPQQYLTISEKYRAEALLEAYDYSGVSKLSLPENVLIWSRYANARLLFDFDTCKKELQKLKNADKLRDKHLMQISAMQENRADRNANNDLLLKEVYQNAKIKFKQEAYVDFLLRFFRVVEEMAREKALAYIPNYTYNYARPETFKTFLDLDANTALKTHFDTFKIKINGREVIADTARLGIPTFLVILFLFEPEYAQKVDGLRVLSEMRNKSIGAHAFEPVSKENIEMGLAENNLTTREMFEILDDFFEIKNNPFDHINKHILTLL
jgi:CRISPR-associated protein (Cas_Cas02710)